LIRAIVLLSLFALPVAVPAQPQQPQQQPSPATRTLSGTILTPRNEVVPGVTLIVRSSRGDVQTQSDGEGNFRLDVPVEAITLKFFGKNIALVSRTVAPGESSENLQIRITYVVPPVHESVRIEATALDPTLDRLNETLFDHTLFLRDDQLFQTLSAGINAGQHEGGGKSLEIRRFGYNLDHGGVSGGLKVL
jgi:hypothetical protein